MDGVDITQISNENELSIFLYEMIVTSFGCLLELVLYRGGKFVASVIQIMLEHFSIKSRLTSYKLNVHGLSKSINNTLCITLAKDADMDESKKMWNKMLHAIIF